MAKTNYGQIRKQKEAARRARHQKKLDRRQARPTDAAPEEATAGAEPVGTPTPRDEPVS